MISCKKVDLNDEYEIKTAIELLNVYAKDLMGGGDELSPDIIKNLPIELKKRSNICHIFIAYIKTEDNVVDSINPLLSPSSIPIGLAICFEGFSTFACKPLLNIHDFCVIPEYRRKGVGKIIILEIERFAKSIECCKLTLEVLSNNKPAQKLYNSVGFEAYELDSTAGHALFWQKKFK